MCLENFPLKLWTRKKSRGLFKIKTKILVSSISTLLLIQLTPGAFYHSRSDYFRKNSCYPLTEMDEDRHTVGWNQYLLNTRCFAKTFAFITLSYLGAVLITLLHRRGNWGQKIQDTNANLCLQSPLFPVPHCLLDYSSLPLSPWVYVHETLRPTP